MKKETKEKQLTCKYCRGHNVVVKGGDEGTNYYYCNDCKKPTDDLNWLESTKEKKTENTGDWKEREWMQKYILEQLDIFFGDEYGFSISKKDSIEVPHNEDEMVRLLIDTFLPLVSQARKESITWNRVQLCTQLLAEVYDWKYSADHSKTEYYGAFLTGYHAAVTKLLNILQEKGLWDEKEYAEYLRKKYN